MPRKGLYSKFIKSSNWNYNAFYDVHNYTLNRINIIEAFYSVYKKWRHAGLPLVNQNVYWPVIGNLVWVIGLSLVICIVWWQLFCRHYKQLHELAVFIFLRTQCCTVMKPLFTLPFLQQLIFFRLLLFINLAGSTIICV